MISEMKLPPNIRQPENLEDFTFNQYGVLI
jgi:hypothetical protein